MTQTQAEATELRSPREVDEELAELTAELGLAYRLRQSVFDSIHNHVGDRKHFVGRERLWNKSDWLVWMELYQALKDGTIVEWNIENAKRSIEQLHETKLTIKDLKDRIAALDEEYNSRPWSRFFSVTNPTGHIHSTMNCSTTYPTTPWAWNPSLSGKSEEEAVAELGPMLCSICFPLAPSDWKRDPSAIRAEVRLRNKKTKPGIFCKVFARGNEEKFKTARSAQIFATQELMDHTYRGYELDEIALQTVIDALSNEWGLTHEETRASLEQKAKERWKRESK